MIKILIEKIIARAESSVQSSSDYVRYIARLSPRAFLYFGMSTPLAAYRRAAPLLAYHAARLSAVAGEGCAPSLSIETRLARRAGMSAEWVLALIENRREELCAASLLARDFAAAVLENAPELKILRRRAVELWGEAATMELALAASAARSFPTIRRGLGY